MRALFSASLTTAIAIALSACASHSGDGMMKSSRQYSQDDVPAAVRVPAGHTAAIATTGVGEITYECRAKADQQGAHAWVFVGPQVDLISRQGNAKVGVYYGPPATWASLDGSKITGVQVATAAGGDGNIPLQLVRANPASGAGAMNGVSYVQRLATRGGTAPARACDASSVGRNEIVKYQADYIFWKPA